MSSLPEVSELKPSSEPIAMSLPSEEPGNDDDDEMFVSPFECPICFGIYNNDVRVPTTFACGHSCCLAHVANMKSCHVCRSGISSQPHISYALRDAAVIYMSATPVIPPTATPQMKTCFRKKKKTSVKKRIRSWCCMSASAVQQ